MSHSSQREGSGWLLAAGHRLSAVGCRPGANSEELARYPSRFSITTCGPMPGTSNSSLTVVYRMRA